MKRKDQIERSNAMNTIAAGQTYLGQRLIIGEGMQRHNEKPNAAYSLGGIPVFHISVNPFTIEPTKPLPAYTKWGEFTHPYLLIGMPSIPGIIQLYVVLINNTHYVLLSSTKLDPDYVGPSKPSLNITCWTAKHKNDSKQKAGERMFHAFLMYMLGLKTEIGTFENEESLLFDWNPSENCMLVMKNIFAN